jgi:hypothetical protein
VAAGRSPRRKLFPQENRFVSGREELSPRHPWTTIAGRDVLNHAFRGYSVWNQRDER